MEFLLLLLVLPLIWLVRLPVRVVGTVRRRPYVSAALGLGVLATVWIGFQVLSDEAGQADYAPGDATLRAMLER
ncbi:hypothetical protein [Devosia sp.]|uniref:hypothetical protein n=1 Tax=Devosia sp. TaxID=1871048 RepID=UPI003A916677